MHYVVYMAPQQGDPVERRYVAGVIGRLGACNIQVGGARAGPPRNRRIHSKVCRLDGWLSGVVNPGRHVQKAITPRNAGGSSKMTYNGVPISNVSLFNTANSLSVIEGGGY